MTGSERHSWGEPQLDQMVGSGCIFFRCCRICGAIQATDKSHGWATISNHPDMARCAPIPAGPSLSEQRQMGVEA